MTKIRLMDTDVKNTLLDLLTDIRVISYSGPFDGGVLSTIASKVENDLTDNPKLNKKILKVFIELAQNIALYSSDKVITDDKAAFNGFGIFMIKESFDKFILISGNMAFKEDAKIVEQKCEKINTLSRDELRDLKRELRKLPMGQKGGGNIGLVQMVLTANSKLDYQIIDVDNKHSFIILSIDINKFED